MAQRVCVGSLDRVEHGPERSIAACSHILVVDADPEIRHRAATVLAGLGYMARMARSAEEALRLCIEGPPEALLTSVMLPYTSGLELASQLRGRFAGLKVIYMSSTHDPVQVSGPIHADSNSLQKPFEPEVLAKKMAELVGARRVVE